MRVDVWHNQSTVSLCQREAVWRQQTIKKRNPIRLPQTTVFF